MHAPAHPPARSSVPARRRRASKWALGVVVVAYLALATLYSIVIPLGEGPDEPGHADYAFFLAREHRLPVQRSDPSQSDVPGEGHQPPLAYLLASAAARLVPMEERAINVVGNPRFVWSGGTEGNALVHGSRAYWPWRGSTLAWHAARFVSVGLGAATVVFTYLIAGNVRCTMYDLRLESPDTSESNRKSKLQNRKSMSLLAAALVAFNPQFLFTMALVTNDALLVALSAALLWLVVRAENKGAGIVTMLAIGVVLGLALITKQSALLLIPIACIGTLRYWKHNSQHGTYNRLLVCLLPWLLVMSIAGWWYARNQQLYGDLLGLSAFRAEFTTQPFLFGSAAAWLGALAQLHDSFWARFGWMNLAPPAWVIAVFVVIEVVALLGYGAVAARHWRTWRFNVQALVMNDMFMLVLLVLLALAWVVSFARTAGLVAWQGRLIFPALPAIAVILARGLAGWESKEHIIKNLRLRALPLFFTLCALFLIALWLPFGVIRPAYTNETLPEQTAQVEPGTPVYARFSDGREKGVELRGWHMEGEAVPGGSLQITLTWHALGRASRDWWVFIQLANGQNQVVARAEAPARSVTFPMTEWTTGDWVRETYTLTLPPELAPGTYMVQFGLFDSQDNRRRDGVYNRAGKRIGNAFDPGTITITQK